MMSSQTMNVSQTLQIQVTVTVDNLYVHLKVEVPGVYQQGLYQNGQSLFFTFPLHHIAAQFPPDALIQEIKNRGLLKIMQEALRDK